MQLQKTLPLNIRGSTRRGREIERTHELSPPPQAVPLLLTKRRNYKQKTLPLSKREYGKAGREIEYTRTISSTAGGPPPLGKEEEL